MARYIHVYHYGDNKIGEQQPDVTTIYNNIILYYNIITMLYLI